MAELVLTVKIDPEKEYESAKRTLESLSLKVSQDDEISSLGGSIDNLKTVINVLMERATPKKRIRGEDKKPKKGKNGRRQEFDKLPSEKFPDLEVKEEVIRAAEVPVCSCCNKEMSESGLFKTSEKLEVMPKCYFITKSKRVVYNCKSCHGSMQNAPAPRSILRQSNYGDSLIIDVSLSKYCDLIPIERYSGIASRQGSVELPANSLIGLTHSLADFLMPVYKKIRLEVLRSIILLCDETLHKMLEGDDRSNWYLWGFNCKTACFLEAHNSRGSEIPLAFLSESDALFLVTDAFSAYKRVVKIINKDARNLIEVYCNAHAYRYFRDASATWKEESEIFLKLYGEIYEIERNVENSGDKTSSRLLMRPLFEKLKDESELSLKSAMPHSSFEKALNYFLNHYPGLTVCIDHVDVPLDNNASERLLRPPVIGRKTWYGTHSKRGAKTNAILFSIVETCKINGVNPRNYFEWIVARIHSKQEVLTPSEYMKQVESG